MLKRLRAFVGYHAQAAQSSLKWFRDKPLANFMTVVVIAITLSLPALFYVFTDNINQLTKPWQQDRRITIYLQSPLTAQEQNDVLAGISKVEGVAEATLKTPAQGLEELQAQEGMQDMMRYLPENPLPAVIDVYPAISVNTPEKLNALFKRLQKHPKVDQAKLDMQWIHRLHTLLALVSTIAHGVMLLLGSAVVLIIGNTLRLAIYNRQEEIRVLKLIGATDQFIIRPFLYSGILYGFLGAIIAIALTAMFMAFLATQVSQLAAAYQMDYPLSMLSLKQVLILIASAVFLGWLGAFLSVKRHLAFIEPYN